MLNLALLTTLIVIVMQQRSTSVSPTRFVTVIDKLEEPVASDGIVTTSDVPPIKSLIPALAPDGDGGLIFRNKFIIYHLRRTQDGHYTLASRSDLRSVSDADTAQAKPVSATHLTVTSGGNAFISSSRGSGHVLGFRLKSASDPDAFSATSLWLSSTTR